MVVELPVFEFAFDEPQDGELGVGTVGEGGNDVWTPMSRWNSSVGSLVCDSASESRYSGCKEPLWCTE